MRCINPAQIVKISRNLKSVALQMAEISCIQILSKTRTATPATRQFRQLRQLWQLRQTEKNLRSKLILTFIIYGIYWKCWFHTKIFEKLFLLKSCFLPIKSHKTWKKNNKQISFCHAPPPPPPLTEICATPTA
jgi:hypothetical protein